MPQTKDSIATSMVPVTSTAVGKRGTSPVSWNVTNTGYASTTARRASSAPMIEKNASGRISLKKYAIIRRMRKPSLNVLSLLSDPDRAP